MATSSHGEQLDPDLQRMWVSVQVQFTKAAGKQFDAKKMLSIEDVVKQIQPRTDSPRVQKAKDVFSKTLTCIQRLGAIASQGASMVFGPSDLCFNAISFLITVGQKVGSIFDCISELYERIGDFIQRFEVYTRIRSIDVAMRRIIHELLCSVMTITTLSLKIVKENKLLLYIKVFAFDSDEGVSAELTKLKRLTDTENAMRGALTFESAMNSNSKITMGFSETRDSLNVLDKKMDVLGASIQEISNAKEKRNKDDARQRQLETVKKAISPKEIYKEVLTNYNDRRVYQTGSWLLGSSAFMEWADNKLGLQPILCISGNEGYGKSYLVSAIIDHLRSRYSQGLSTSRTSIAYYFFEYDNKVSQSKDTPSVNQALRAVVWQLAQNDLVYLKDASKCCNNEEDFGSNEKLFQRLFRDLAAKTDATFYIILDGLDIVKKEKKHLSQIVDHITARPEIQGQLRIRLLLSGRPETLYDLECTAFPTIVMGTQGQDDLSKFVAQGIEEIEVLSGKSDQDKMDKLKRDIFTALTEGAKGDFVKAQMKLNEIKTKTRLSQIEEVLLHAGEKRSNTIMRELVRLNSELAQEDIEDLNKILSWIVCARAPVTIARLESILYLKNGEDLLLPLKDQIQNRYAALLSVSGYDDEVSLVSEEVKDLLAAGLPGSSNLTTPGDVEINVHEIKIVKRLLKNMCDEELFARFGFEEFFLRKSQKPGCKIGINVNDAHFEVLLDCLAVMHVSNKHTDSLLEYACICLPEHLKNIDLTLLEPTRKSRMGPQLLGIFIKDDLIDRWWSSDRTEFLGWEWMEERDAANEVKRFLKDSAVVKTLYEENPEWAAWAKELTSGLSTSTDLMEPTAIVFAKRWLQSSDLIRDVDVLLHLIHVFITRVRNPSNVLDTTDYGYDAGDITQQDILEAWTWACTKLSIVQPDFNSTVQLANTYREYGLDTDAIEAFQKSQRMAPASWQPCAGLARTYAQQENWDLAVQNGELVLRLLREDKESIDERRDSLFRIVCDLADWHGMLGNFDTSFSYYHQLLEEDPENYEWILKLLQALSEQGNAGEITKQIQKLRTKVDENTGYSRLVTFYHRIGPEGRFHTIINKAAKETDSLELIKDVYQNAVDAAEEDLRQKKPEAFWTFAFLRQFQALFLYQYSRDGDEEIEAISNLEKSHEIWVGKAEVPWSFNRTSNILGSVYLERMRATAPGSLIANAYLQKFVQLAQEVHSPVSVTASDAGEIGPKLLLGRYFRIIQNEHDSRKCFEDYVRVALDLLSDDDPKNDWQGYQVLAIILMYYGDDVNALAAWSLIGPEESKKANKNDDGSCTEGVQLDVQASIAGHAATNGNLKTTDSEDIGDSDKKLTSVTSTEASSISKQKENSKKFAVSTNNVPRRGPVYYRCAGGCGYRWTYADDLYICKDCLDVQFDLKCLEKLRKGELGFKFCGGNHEWLHVPKWDEDEHKLLGAGQVRVGGTVRPIAEWLNNIRTDWGFPLPVKAQI